MIFYDKKNRPRVWSGKNKRPPVVFYDGVFETSDKELIELLIKAGYPYKENKKKTKTASQPALKRKTETKKVPGAASTVEAKQVTD